MVMVTSKKIFHMKFPTNYNHYGRYLYPSGGQHDTFSRIDTITDDIFRVARIDCRKYFITPHLIMLFISEGHLQIPMCIYERTPNSDIHNNQF